jgi:hypothetical protein
MIPELKRVTLDGNPVTNETEFLKEFPTSVYVQIYTKWEACKDAKDRPMTVLLWRATSLLLSLWEDNLPYLRKYATDFLEARREPLENGMEHPPIVLPMDLPGVMKSMTADDFMELVDKFSDELPKPYLKKLSDIMDAHLAPLSDEKQLAEKNE